MRYDKIESLRKELVEAKDLSTILRHFIAELASDPEFMAAGKPFPDDDGMLDALREIATRAVGESRPLAGGLMRIAEHNFRHGALVFGRQPMIAFYFEDSQQGFLALVGGKRPNDFVRFSFVAAPGGQRTPAD